MLRAIVDEQAIFRFCANLVYDPGKGFHMGFAHTDLVRQKHLFEVILQTIVTNRFFECAFYGIYVQSVRIAQQKDPVLIFQLLQPFQAI